MSDNKLKILLVGNIKGSMGFIQNLSALLVKNNCQVDILDLWSMNFIDCNEIKSIRLYSFKLFDIFLKIPVIHKFTRKFIAIFFLKRINKRYNIVNFHYVSRRIYGNLISFFKRKSDKLVLSVWGSDFLRASNERRENDIYIYDAVDAITFNNPVIREEFIGYFRDYEKKCLITGFGIRNIDLLDELNEMESINESKRKLGISEDSFIITCGYNANTAQQHEIIIEHISNIKSSLPDNTFIILPMTYYLNDDFYIERLEVLLKKSFNYKIFKNNLTDIDVARIRRITDIAVNMQMTDQLSASIIEHLYSNNIVFVGKWLPYKIFEDLGIFLIRVNIDDFESSFCNTINNFENIKILCNNNPEFIRNNFSWKIRIQKWIELYNDLLDHETIDKK